MHALSSFFISAAYFSAFIAVLTNTKMLNFFTLILFMYNFSSYSYAIVKLLMHNRKYVAFICTGRIIACMAMIWWLDYIKCNSIYYSLYQDTR